jgi:hypothetical protein
MYSKCHDRNGANQSVATFFVRTSVAIEGICLLGLLVIGIVAFFRSN